MLDAKFIREHQKEVKTSLARRYMDAPLEKILTTDEKRISIQKKLDDLRAKRRQLAESVKGGKPSKDIQEKGKKLKDEIEKLEKDLGRVEDELSMFLLEVPNLLAKDVPDGRTEEENRELKRWGKPKKFAFPPHDHVELGKRLNIIDIETAAKVSGSRFFYLKNEGALLELALVNFSVKKLIEKGFTLVSPPHLVKERITTATGFRPKSQKERQLYKIEEEDLYLIATTEVPILGLHADEVFFESGLPKFYVGLSAAFRTEAGSWGKDVRGILRTHEFHQTEMFVFAKPEDSESIHDKLVSYEEEIFQELNIPYRVVSVCAGDLGAPAYKKYDLEAWIPSQKRYREVTSCSNTTDYQARRLNIRFKRKSGKSEYVHTLNGTGVAVGRAIIAILENNQREDGSVEIPKVLRPYVGKDVIIPQK